ncbi:MAG: tetratricopeptide repeat protein [Spirochaetales bacterium]|nr:tetratricopeptide repeat protein [Spirochaetales bacterium]
MKNTKTGYLENLINKAVEDGRRRDYVSAIKKLKTVLNVSDEYPSALLYLGRACHGLGRWDEAVMTFRMYITRMPKSNAGFFYLGRTYLAMKKYSRASSCFSEAVKLNPKFAPAHAYFGYSLLRKNMTAEAVASLENAVGLEPENGRIYSMYINSVLILSIKQFRRENFDSAVQGFLFLEEAGYSSITTILYIGLGLKELGNYTQAADYLQRAVDASPDDDLIKNFLAETFIRCSRVDDALNLLGSYLSPDEVKTFLNEIENAEENFAVSCWQKQDYQKALHFAIVSLKANRTSKMHLLAGECLKFLGRFDDSYNHFCRAGEIDKKAVEPDYGKAVILWLEKKYSNMIKLLVTIISKNPEDDFASYYMPLCKFRLEYPCSEWKTDIEVQLKKGEDPWLLTALGFSYISTGNYAKSEKIFRQALKQNRSHREAWKGLFSALRTFPEQKKLMTALKQYALEFPHDSERREELITLLIRHENFKAAAIEIMSVTAENAPDTKALHRLAYCHRKAGNYRDAIIIYRQLLNSDPYNEKYLKLLLFCMRKSDNDIGTLPLMEAAIDFFKKPSLDLMLVYGAALYRNNRDEEALNIFQKCIFEGYKDWRVFRNMGIIYKNKGMKEWSEMYMKKSKELR